MKKLLLLSFCVLYLSAFGQPWFEKANYGGEARHRTSTFTIGDDGYLGLGHINSGVDVEFEDFWKYDPASDSWSQIANYPEGRCYHAVSFSIGNKAYVGTGRLENGTFSKKIYCYDPLFNSWTQIADLPGLARRGSVAFTINGKAYVGTGQTTSGYSADFYEYNPTTNIWTAKAMFPGAVRTSSVAFSIGNFGYVGTGNTNMGSTNDFYQYNPATNTWVAKAPVGPTTRQEAVGFAVNGLGYIGTGDDFSSGNNYSDMWEYDPTLNTWVLIEEFAGTARRYLSAFVIGSRAYAGTGTNGTNFRDFWMFDQILSVLKRNLDHVEIVVFPNPSSEKIVFDLNSIPEFVDVKNISCSIYSLSGELLAQKQFENKQLQLNVNDLNSGVYFYKLQHQNEPFKTGKLIVSH